MNKKVFISYSRKDYIDENNNPIEESAVGRIVETLELNGIEVWIDINTHYGDKYFTEVLAKKIQQADKVLFISSANSNESDWVEKEIIYANEHKRPIVTLLIDESPFNNAFGILVAGFNYIEYYKNEKKALEKLVLDVNDEEQAGSVVIPKPRISILKALKLAVSFILVFLVVFSVFACIGFAVGYYKNLADVNNAMKEAFRENRFTAIDNHTLQYSGETMSFTFDVETTKLKMAKKQTGLIEYSLESITLATAIPIAFKNLLKSSQFAGNGKTKASYLIIGSVAIIFGYGIGEPLGKSSAISHNEDELREFFDKEANIEIMKQKLALIYQ